MKDGVNPKDLIGATKAPLRLVPPALVIGAAEALAVGAAKYGPYNWRDYPVTAVTYFEAARRHLDAWFDGEDFDPETGVHHVKHAAAGLAILLDCLGLGTLKDDRPPTGPASALLAEQNRSVPPEDEGDAPPVPEQDENAEAEDEVVHDAAECGACKRRAEDAALLADIMRDHRAGEASAAESSR